MEKSVLQAQGIELVGCDAAYVGVIGKIVDVDLKAETVTIRLEDCVVTVDCEAVGQP
jgi:hypothetical protein